MRTVCNFAQWNGVTNIVVAPNLSPRMGAHQMPQWYGKPVLMDTQNNASETEQPLTPATCIVCVDRDVEVRLPCGHSLMCIDCHEEWHENRGNHTCSVCRRPFGLNHMLFLGTPSGSNGFSPTDESPGLLYPEWEQILLEETADQ